MATATIHPAEPILAAHRQRRTILVVNRAMVHLVRPVIRHLRLDSMAARRAMDRVTISTTLNHSRDNSTTARKLDSEDNHRTVVHPQHIKVDLQEGRLEGLKVDMDKVTDSRVSASNVISQMSEY